VEIAQADLEREARQITPFSHELRGG
jgi:hypothetical protein